MIDLSRYSAIIFDMDGTILDSMDGHVEAWLQVADHFGYKVEASYLHAMGGVSSIEMTQQLNQSHGLNHDPQEVAARKYEIWLALDPKPEIIAETHAVFQHYRPTMKIAVGTGAPRKTAVKLLSEAGLLDQLDALVTSSDVVKGKPAGDTFLKAAELMGVDPRDCVVFEDTEIGRQAATAAGMDCILVKDGKIQH